MVKKSHHKMKVMDSEYIKCYLTNLVKYVNLSKTDLKFIENTISNLVNEMRGGSKEEKCCIM